MNAHPLLAGLRTNPDSLLQNFDLVNHSALLVRVNEALYREASFLDDRIFTPNMEGYWFPLDAVAETLIGLAVPAPHYIFQVGHCGSTLISRLLAELPGNLPVREPITLLALAVVLRELDKPPVRVSEEQWKQLLELTKRALSRTYRSGDRAIIKATSTAGNLVETLVQDPVTVPQMLLMYITMESLLATMLRSPDLRESIHADRLAWVTDFVRLTGRKDLRPMDLNDAQQVVVKWLTLMLLFMRTVSAAPAQAQLLNFDDFLKTPAEQLTAVAEHFRLKASADQVEQLISGHLMHSYSKIPTQTFDPNQREQELREARRLFHNEIQTGLRWAEKLCREIPALEPVSRYLHNGT